MILVILGTWRMPFVRPLKEIEQLIISGIIRERVIVQAGVTQYLTSNMDVRSFLDKEEFDKLYDEATLIITHAGEGSIILGLKKNKRVISIARLVKYNEHIDDHQLDILSVFSSKNYLLAWEDEVNLEDVLNKLNTFVPVPYPFSEDKISEAIIDFLEKKD
ncbi:PssE/Cps14G family polysaccharide biosynthesis glycosyltransferase [Mucilaginibacter sp.]|uniref:PssE/Cps14G family polysaccharide biosynthesis glycosyltransferase n=1 Tax=Mucilaginibacter sp. TaxID=1882438 RepID=UPI00284366DD|nr:PssE/Cps14G family polysaccharide biosynthesis glycosyltransferase [Mucilaginibacter sp.]MDR3696312.1 PssE/Cps14G family polysaccharide biosynthesis glycosyltransferase [Mucilaginibacter sp.]